MASKMFKNVLNKSQQLLFTANVHFVVDKPIAELRFFSLFLKNKHKYQNMKNIEKLIHTTKTFYSSLTKQVKYPCFESYLLSS